MQTIISITNLRNIVLGYRKENLRIAFIPTMGNLHAGHLSLIDKAKLVADKIIVSIFVNPLQFGPHEDFHTYPRTLNQDSLKLADSGVHLLFLPDSNEIVMNELPQHTRVTVPIISDELCGLFRPGHFQGVATIVAKLLNLVQPDIVILGEKDYQQLYIVRKMVTDLCMPVEVIGSPIMRESDGLAFSSRNQYLSQQERTIAPMLYNTLTKIQTSILQGAKNYEQLCQNAMNTLTTHSFRPDYLSIRRLHNLQPATAHDHLIIILAAAYLGKTRLIDNIIFEKPF